MIKIYGIQTHLNPIKAQLSDVINDCMVSALKFPANKRAHRFFPMPKEDFYYPDGRTDAYTVIEITMIEGRSIEAKKALIHTLFAEIEDEIGLSPVDVEVIIIDSPAHNFGFRGMTGDEARLNYKIEV